MCEYFNTKVRPQDSKFAWKSTNFSTLKWGIDFKLWYKKDLYNTIFYHKKLGSKFGIEYSAINIV